MKFIDECVIKVAGGKGGDGVISFRREAKVPKGGPDGGDGGNGGSVFFQGDSGINTLLTLKYMQKIKGNDGDNGKSKNRYGKSGEDLIIRVPIGTMVYNKKTNELICDVIDDQLYLIAKGGKGGKGNVKFKSSKNTAPRLSENGLPGQEFELLINLKVLADVGFVGKPSAGKSTVLSIVSNAKPKIADYEFTTLTPQLGIVYVNKHDSFVVADLPGLIKGASEGKGLGYTFLKHIDRTKCIAHIIDFGDSKKNPIQDYFDIREELKNYSESLFKKPEIIIANKSDLENVFNENLKKFKEKFDHLEIIPISALKQTNLDLLKKSLLELTKKTQEVDINDEQIKEITISLKENEIDQIIVTKINEHIFDVKGAAVERLVNLIPLNSPDNFRRFNRLLKEIGVWKELEENSIKTGDLVKIYKYEFEWQND